MKRLIQAWVGILALLWAGVLPAKEIALIIGIDEYEELPSLNKALEDATGYSELFTDKGFDVSFVVNPTGTEMRLQLAAFYDSIEDGDTVVFIYSGHGWSDGLQNYLVPADTPDLGSAASAAELTIPLRNGISGVLDQIAARGAGLSVAIIDACRNNPFSSPATRSTGGVNGGLAPIEPPSGSFIVYSAAANQTALDSLGEADDFQYSVFTRFFLPNLRDYGDLRTAIVETRGQVQEVASIIGHQQRPAYYDELGGTSCLFGNCDTGQHQPEGQQLAVNTAQIEWDLIKNSTDKALIAAFIERHQNTSPDLVEQARATLLNLTFTVNLDDLSTLGTPEVAEPGVQDENSPAAIAFAQAKERIAQSNGITLRLSDLPALRAIPDEIGTMAGLRFLRLENTQIRDLSPIAGLTTLEEIYLDNTNVSDISVLAQLVSLKQVSLSGTYVRQVSDLSGLDLLEGVSLDDTQVFDLTPLYQIPGLRDISIENTPAQARLQEGKRLYDLAMQYQSGDGVWRNYGRAIELYQQSLALDYGDAANQLGGMYYTGKGVPANASLALEFFRVGASLNSARAAFNLATRLHNGDGTAPDAQSAGWYFYKAVSLGNSWLLEENSTYFLPDTVKVMQQLLTEHGYYRGRINGTFNPDTRAAMRALCNCG